MRRASRPTCRLPRRPVDRCGKRPSQWPACRGSTRRWSTTSPQRTRKAAAAIKGGTEKLELVGGLTCLAGRSAEVRDPQGALYPIEARQLDRRLKAGRRVAAKGIWIPARRTVSNLTSVAVLDESCGATGRRQATRFLLVLSEVPVREPAVPRFTSSNHLRPSENRRIHKSQLVCSCWQYVRWCVLERKDGACPGVVVRGFFTAPIGGCLLAEQKKGNDTYYCPRGPRVIPTTCLFWDPEYLAGTWDVDLRFSGLAVCPGRPVSRHADDQGD